MTVLDSLEAEFGLALSARLSEGEGGASWGGALGSVQVAPSDEAAVLALVRWAVKSGVRLRPLGAGIGFLARPELRNPEDPTRKAGSDSRPTVWVSSRRFDAILDHSPADLTVRVQSGVLLSALDAEVRRSGQWFPIDPPGGGHVTVGGTVAMGLTGPLAAGTGRLRDHLLGATLVSGRGERLPLGGRVVKNVAGFDVLRLLSGSRGRLGFITEVTLRLYPVPVTDLTLVWNYASAAVGIAHGRQLARTGIPFSALEWLGALSPDAGVVAARIQGRPETVASLQGRLAEVGGVPELTLEGEGSREWWAERSAWEAGDLTGVPGGHLRQGARPSDGAAVASALAERWAPQLKAGADRGTLAVHLLHGGVRVRVPGNVTLGAPIPSDSVKARVLRQIQEGFDPEGVFAPASPEPGAMA